MIIYVDASVIQTGNGTKENPFKTVKENGYYKIHGVPNITSAFQTETDAPVTPMVVFMHRDYIT